jgi:arginyl-tRNA synthetase
VSGSAAYELIVLTKNQKIHAKSGTLEIILRPGSEARIMSQHEDIGVADITSGKELLHNAIAPINNALLVPRADGRGLYITSEIAYILVRGEYEVYE